VNSLANLNSYSNDFLTFNDERPETYLFQPDSPISQSITVYENQTHNVPVGTNITGLFNANAVSYSINISDHPGTTISWGNLSGLGTGNLTTSTVGNVYTVSNIISTVDWNIVKSPTVTMAVNPPDYWDYVCTINYGNAQTKSWTVAVDVQQLDQLTSSSSHYYNDGVPEIILGTPQYYNTGIAEYDDATFTLSVAPTPTNALVQMTSSGMGVASSFNPTTKTLTVTGNSAVIVSHLANIELTPIDDNFDSYTLTYSLYNADSNFTTVKTQNIVAIQNIYMSEPSPIYYSPNTSKILTNTPLITDVEAPTSTTYSLAISSTTANTITSLSSTGSGGTSTWNNSTKTLTIAGTKAQINSHLANVTIQPGLDYTSDFDLKYALTLPSTLVVIKLQTLVSSGADEVSNLDVYRYLTAETPALLWPTDYPQITETVPNVLYKITISTNGAGHVGIDGQSTWGTTSTLVNYTKAQINDLLAGGPTFGGGIKYYPQKSATGFQILNIKIWRTPNGASYTIIADSNIIVNLADRTLPIPGIATYSYTTPGTYFLYPTYEQVNYLNNLYVVRGARAGTIVSGTSLPSNYNGRGLRIIVGAYADAGYSAIQDAVFYTNYYRSYGGSGSGNGYATITYS
jgi:hypothetical protein